MSDTLLGGDLTVYYFAENRRKQIRWTGGAGKGDNQKMVDTYDAVQDLFTVSTQMDDGIIFSGETPAEYSIGKIDAGEIDPWFIDLETMEHILGDFANFTGCALKTIGWKRDLPGDGSGNTGIMVVPVLHSTNNIVKGDIGQDITHADLDAGTLLDVVITGGTTDYLFIRPDSNALANDWNSVSGVITEAGLSHTAAQTAAGVTGEMIWGNPYSQGALDPDTHIYMFQDGTKITGNDQTDNDYWEDGHLDKAVPITDYTTANFPLIDQGYLTIFARQYAYGFSYTIIRMNTTSGGAVSAGLSSGVDGNNQTGYKSITFTASANNWSVGDEMSGDSSGARGIITKIVNPGATQTVHYYLVGDPMTDFNTAIENLTNEDDTGTGTKNGSAPADQGPANLTLDPTLTFANTTDDIDDDSSSEPYGITIDVNQNSLADLYEWLKYSCRRGSILDMDGLDGEEFIGIDFRVNYTTLNGTISEGDTVTGVTSTATAIVVSHDTVNDVALLRNTRGEFQDAEQIQKDAGNYWAATGLTATAITPIAACPYGTLAGGVFFGGVGVLLTDYQSGDANKFELKDANGVTRKRPTQITMTISNLLDHDWAACYRLTGAAGSVKKDEYSAAGGEAIGDITLVAGSSIAKDVPGKTNGGRLVLVDVSDNNKEYTIRFSSWATATFTLANIDIALADVGTDTDTIIEAGAFTNAKVGDLVYNHTRSAVSYVKEVVSNNEVSIFPAIASQTTDDHIEINCVPIAVLAADKIFVPLILEFVDGVTEISSQDMQYLASIYGRTRVRNTGDAIIKIKPFTSDVTVDTGGGSTTAVRTKDPVYGA